MLHKETFWDKWGGWIVSIVILVVVAFGFYFIELKPAAEKSSIPVEIQTEQADSSKTTPLGSSRPGTRLQ